MQNGWIVPSQRRTEAVQNYNVTAYEYNRIVKQMGLGGVPTGDPDHMTIADLSQATLTLKALITEALQKGTNPCVI